MIMIILTVRPAQDEPWRLPDPAAIGAITPFSFAEIAEVISECRNRRYRYRPDARPVLDGSCGSFRLTGIAHHDLRKLPHAG